MSSVFAAKEKWEKDADVRHCRRCSKPFGLMTRKSHCRLCGRIFCGDCVHALDAAEAPGAASQSVKACQRCIVQYHDAQRQRGVGKQPATEPATSARAKSPVTSAAVDVGVEAPSNSVVHEAGEATPATSGHDHESSRGGGTSGRSESGDCNLSSVKSGNAASNGHVGAATDCDACSRPADDGAVTDGTVPPQQQRTTTDAGLPVAEEQHKEHKAPATHECKATPTQQHKDPLLHATQTATASEHTPTLAPPNAATAHRDHNTGGSGGLSGGPEHPTAVATVSTAATAAAAPTPSGTVSATAKPTKPAPRVAKDDEHRQRSFTVTAEESRASISLERSEVFDFCHACGRVEDRCTCPRDVLVTSPLPLDNAHAPIASRSDATTTDVPTQIVTPVTAAHDAPLTVAPSSDARRPTSPPKQPSPMVERGAPVEGTGSSMGDVDHRDVDKEEISAETQCSADDVSISNTTGGASNNSGDQHLSTSASFASTATGGGGGGAARATAAPTSHDNGSIPSSTSSPTVVEAVIASNRLAPDALASSTSSSNLLDPESAKVASRCARFLKPAERILKIQTVNKSRYMMSHVRVLVLTDFPRLFYVDEGNVLKGSLVLDPRKTRVVANGPRTFVVAIDGGKDYNFTTAAAQDADAWVQKLHNVLHLS